MKAYVRTLLTKLSLISYKETSWPINPRLLGKLQEKVRCRNISIDSFFFYQCRYTIDWTNPENTIPQQTEQSADQV